MSGQVDIHEVARIAGVSTATVSRVLNGFAGVRPATRERVEAAVEQTGYRPNLVARAFQQKRAAAVGFVLPYVHDYYARRVDAATDVLQGTGYRMLLTTTRRTPGALVQALELLESERVSGAIVSPILLSEEEKAALVGFSRRVPLVVLDTAIGDGVPVVRFDDREAGRLAARHLVERGCRDVVLLRGPEGHGPSDARYAGWHDVLDGAGIPAGTELTCGFAFENGAEAVRELLRVNSRLPEAILFTNDDAAIGGMAAIRESGFRMPEDVSVVSIDGSFYSRYAVPPLTTVEQDQRLAGRAAAEVLVQGGKGRIIPEQRLLVRGSVK